MRALRKRSQRRERGQSLIEFALVVPLFLLLMLGLIDFSRLLFTYISVANGAREMARAVAQSYNWSSANPNASVTAFNDYTLIAGSQSSATDSITLTYGDFECAHNLDTGSACSSTAPDNMTTKTCALPMTTWCATMAAPPQGGFVQVQVNYTFHFNPLFQNRLDGIIDVSFLQPTAQVTTTARTYVE
jgi:Flp pilus assembly protein TadG